MKPTSGRKLSEIFDFRINKPLQVALISMLFVAFIYFCLCFLGSLFWVFGIRQTGGGGSNTPPPLFPAKLHKRVYKRNLHKSPGYIYMNIYIYICI